jgi:hypothetical protein
MKDGEYLCEMQSQLKKLNLKPDSQPITMLILEMELPRSRDFQELQERESPGAQRPGRSADTRGPAQQPPPPSS